MDNQDFFAAAHGRGAPCRWELSVKEVNQATKRPTESSSGSSTTSTIPTTTRRATGGFSQPAGVLKGSRGWGMGWLVGPPELLDKEKYRGIGHDKSAPGGMAEIGLTNSSVTNSPITPIPSRRLLTHNCFRKGGIPAEIELVLNCFCKILLPALLRKIYSQSFEIAKAPNLRHLNGRH